MLTPTNPARCRRSWGSQTLPQPADLVALKACLYDQFHIEVPLIEWNGRKFMRISVQAYNSQEDIDVLLEGLKVLLRS